MNKFAQVIKHHHEISEQVILDKQPAILAYGVRRQNALVGKIFYACDREACLSDTRSSHSYREF